MKYRESKELWRGGNVRDSVVCVDCGFSRCIYSPNAKGSTKYIISKERQEEHCRNLQQWKREDMFVARLHQ